MARALGDLALAMQNQTGTTSTLEAVVKGAVGIVPGARWAGVSLIEGREVTPKAPSDPLVARLDTLQTELDEGPCLSSLREHHTVQIDDMATEDPLAEVRRGGRRTRCAQSAVLPAVRAAAEPRCAQPLWR